MPLYEYEHVAERGETCSARFELAHSISEDVTQCPRCGLAVKRVVSQTSYRRNVLTSSNLREKGFKRLRRRDKGVYEPD